MRFLVAVVLVACSHPAPPAQPPSQKKTTRVAVSSTPTCADMGPMLRGHVEDEDTDGPKKEAVIVSLCTSDRWSAETIGCVARSSEPAAPECLTKLTDEQRARYTAQTETFGLPEEGDVAPVEETFVECEEAFGALALDAWPPAVTAEAERALARALRSAPLKKLCDDEHWDQATRACFAKTPISGIDECMLELGDARTAQVTKAIVDADALRGKIVKAKPAAITCEKVAAARYADARWKGKAPELAGAARTKAIAASKKAFLDACTKSAWSAEARGCLVAAPDDARCFDLAKVTASRWGYPPLATGAKWPSTGIPECDDYAAAIEKLAACEAIPEASRDAMKDAFEQAAAAWKDMSAAQHPELKAACRAAADATLQAASSCT